MLELFAEMCYAFIADIDENIQYILLDGKGKKVTLLAKMAGNFG